MRGRLAGRAAGTRAELLGVGPNAFAVLLFATRPLLLLLILLTVRPAVTTAGEQLDDRQVQLAAWQVNLHDPRLHGIADADAIARAPPLHDARALVDIPVVVHQVLVADEAVDEIRAELHE